MKSLTIIMLLVFHIPSHTKAQNEAFTLKFSANHSCTYIQLDSIWIKNITQGGSKILYYPDTLLTYVITGIDPFSSAYKEVRLTQNYPNPFSGQTSFDIYTPNEDDFLINIYDLTGRSITTHKARLEQGMHHFTFHACNRQNYILSLVSSHFAQQNLMIQIGQFGSYPHLEYMGKTSPSMPYIEHVDKTASDEFIWDYGDELRMTCYVTDLAGNVDQSFITDIPLESKDYLFEIASNPPTQPSAITGPSIVLLDEIDLAYEVDMVARVTYIWHVPGGWNINGGHETHAITVDAGSESGLISVRAENNCGVSPERSMSVTVKEPDDPDYNTLIAGTWKMAPIEAALSVYPADRSITYWQSSWQDLNDRACYFDDEYLFYNDSTFKNKQKGETWLEPWQTDVGHPHCGTPVPPHDGSADATWTVSDNTLIIQGKGAYIGLPKVIYNDEIDNPEDAAEEIPYPFEIIQRNEADTLSTDTMVIEIPIMDGETFWKFILVKVSDEVTEDPVLSWVNLQWPYDGNITEGESFVAYAWAYIDGLTGATATPEGLADLSAWIGYSKTNASIVTDFSGDQWTWIKASLNDYVDMFGKNSEYFANIGVQIEEAGTYYYVSRFQYDQGDYVYGGLNNGFWDGIENVSGVLVVEPAGPPEGIPCPEEPLVTDIDGNVYKALLIGNRCWLKENLRTTKYHDGTPIDYPENDYQLWENNTTGAYAWYDNDSSLKEKYGALYNWPAVNNGKGICPPGWHVPSDEEWKQLTDQIGGTASPYGNMLKSCRQPGSPLGSICNTSEHPRWDFHETHFGTDDFGFSALPGGVRYKDGGFNLIGHSGIFWSVTETDIEAAVVRGLYSSFGHITAYHEDKSAGFSVRCIKSETTAAILPEVTTAAITHITQSTATGGGNVTHNGWTTINERGIAYSASPDPTISDHIITAGSGMGTFIADMTGMEPETTYYVRAYATNSAGTAYGEQAEFTTQRVITPPIVTTSEVTDITQTTARGGGEVTDDGGAEVTDRGIAYSTSPDPTISDHIVTAGSGTGTFIADMTGLEPETTYYVRAYATNSAGTAYGKQAEFTTLRVITPPIVTTSEVTDITQTTARGGGEVTDDGGAEVTDRGIAYSTSPNPTTNDHTVTAGSGMGTFIADMTSLEPETTYYVRAYATNSTGTAYGKEVEFTTLRVITLPVVYTYEATNISQYYAYIGAEVTDDGGATVNARGVAYAISPNPTINDNVISAGSGTGTFGRYMSDLEPETTYFVRAYATNSAGTAYGNQIEFTTLKAITPPVVTTSKVTDITQTSASGGGEVTDNGGAEVTDRGIVYSTSPDPTISDHIVTAGNRTGAFSADMTGLEPETTYYVRAYAINSAGTAYGEQVEFTTLKVITPPVVTTSEVTDITQTSARGGGEITDDGGAEVTDRGIAYSTSPDPTISDHLVTAGNGMGAFSADMTGLEPETTYYVRAYATNSAGTTYGEQVEFTTLPEHTIPTVVTGKVTYDPTGPSAVVGGNVTSDGGDPVTSRGIVWIDMGSLLIFEPSLEDHVIEAGSGTGIFEATMESLSYFNTYYVRAFATNSIGTAYGKVVEFYAEPDRRPEVETVSVEYLVPFPAPVGYAACTGNVINDHSLPITSRGFVYSLDSEPTLHNGEIIYVAGGSGEFFERIGYYGDDAETSYPHIELDKTHYVRAFAINAAGITYGEIMTYVPKWHIYLW